MIRRTIIPVLLAVLCVSCGPTTGSAAGKEQVAKSIDPYFYKDRGTGCEYLATRTENGLVPRMAPDGKTHSGCKAVQP